MSVDRDLAVAKVAPVKWRVQWYSRPDVGEPERAEGRQDFDTEQDARAWYASDEVRRRVDPYWRVELQCRGPWQTVDARAFGEVPS